MPAGRLPPIAKAMREYAQIKLSVGEDRPVSFEEAIARVERGAISRRELFWMGGITGAALILAACTNSATQKTSSGGGSKPTPHDARVVVVGAGLAGTTAAYRLWQNGVNVRCYEARDRIGGRCWTAREFADGQIAEHGGEFIDTRHVHIRQLAKELGLKMDDLWSGWVPGSKWFMWVNDERNVWGDWKDEQEPVVNAAINEAKRLGVVGNGKKYDDAPLSYGTATPEAVEMDQMSMADWLEEKSPGTAGAPIGTLLNEFMQAWYGLDMKDLSSLNWIDFYVAPWPGGDERWRVHGGNDQVTTLSAEALPAGTVRLEAPLESLRKTGDTYELRFGGIPDPVVADFVIMTIPFTTLKDVDLTDAGFSGQRVGAIDNLSMGLDVKMFLQYDRRPEEFDMWSGGMEHTNPNFETWESSEAQKGKAGLITIYSGGTGSETFAHENYHAPAPQEMTDLMLGEINKVVPGTEAHFNGKAWLDYWVGDPWTRGSYAAFGPGEYTKYWRYTGLPEGNVKFAGEHTSTYSQGFLNGGVESGQRAAIEVMDDLGVKVPAQIADMPYSKFG